MIYFDFEHAVFSGIIPGALNNNVPPPATGGTGSAGKPSFRRSSAVDDFQIRRLQISLKVGRTAMLTPSTPSPSGPSAPSVVTNDALS